MASPESWREAGQALCERARLAWALGAALDEALSAEAPCGEGAVATLEPIVTRALAGPGGREESVAQPSGESGRGAVAHPRREPTPVGDAQTVWRQMQATDLAGKSGGRRPDHRVGNRRSRRDHGVGYAGRRGASAPGNSTTAGMGARATVTVVRPGTW